MILLGFKILWLPIYMNTKKIGMTFAIPILNKLYIELINYVLNTNDVHEVDSADNATES